MFGNGTTQAGGDLWSSIEGDVSTLLGNLTTAGTNAINQQINPTPSFNSSSILLIAAVAIVAILVLR